MSSVGPLRTRLGSCLLVAIACGPTTGSSSEGGADGSTSDTPTTGGPDTGATENDGGATGDTTSSGDEGTAEESLPHDGSDGADTGTDDGIDCHPNGVECDGPIPECPPGEVPSVAEGCWSECVPILACATVSSCDDCNGFCAAYLAFAIEYRCVMPSLQCAALACSCMAPYFCVEPFDACVVDPDETPALSCECPTC
jgi:hypothetical protein